MTNGIIESKWTTERLARLSFVAGGIGAVLSLIGVMLDRSQFFRSYLFAYLFWFAIPLGSLAILMMHFLVGGMWGWVIRRILEAASRTLPVMALLFVPILLGMHTLYPWTESTHVAGDSALQHKAAYLNAPFFVLRTLLYFILWCVIAHLLNRWSKEQDATAELPGGQSMRRVSGPGLLLYFLTMTFASIDWVMSIEPHWFSTIYGVIWVVNQGLSALAFAIVGLTYVRTRTPAVAQQIEANYFHDLGNLLLAFLMLWAYMAFSQYLIIWSGNLAEEIPWYITRTRGAWRWVPPALIAFHFFVPFFLLLMRDVKRNSFVLGWLAIGILAVKLVDIFWLVVPGFGVNSIHWLDPSLVIAIGGLWLGFFFWQLQKMPLLPAHMPVLAEESAVHG
jgi:hypothetical protein